MFETLLMITGLVLIAAMIFAFVTTRDPLHPMLLVGPLYFYMIVIRPWHIMSADGFFPLIPEESMLVTTAMVFLAGIIAFSIGCLLPIRRGVYATTGKIAPVPQLARTRLVLAAIILACIAFLVFTVSVVSRGGLFAVYGTSKGFVITGFGHFDELRNLAFVACAFMLLAWRDQPKHWWHYVVLILLMSAELFHAVFGARRGPIFRTLAVLFLGRFIVGTPFRASFIKTYISMALILVALLFVFTQRSQIYLGSEYDFKSSRFFDTLLPSNATIGGEYTISAATVYMSQELNRHYWGKRYLTQTFVRPIPKILLPNKYNAVGFGWLANCLTYSASGMPRSRWNNLLGWKPGGGCVFSGFIIDFFLEFSWGGIIACFLLGYFLGYLWRKSRQVGNLWALLQFEMAILYVYLPTQPLEATSSRFIMLAVPTILVWHVFIRPAMAYPTEPLTTVATSKDFSLAHKLVHDRL